DDADRVDLAPDRAVDPGDRVEDDDPGADAGRPLAGPELLEHRPDDVAERRVGQDRRDLDQVADPAEDVADHAHGPQDVEVARAVVDEESAAVEAGEAVVRELVRPELERLDVVLEAGPGE